MMALSFTCKDGKLKGLEGYELGCVRLPSSKLAQSARAMHQMLPAKSRSTSRAEGVQKEGAQRAGQLLRFIENPTSFEAIISYLVDYEKRNEGDILQISQENAENPPRSPTASEKRFSWPMTSVMADVASLLNIAAFQRHQYLYVRPIMYERSSSLLGGY
ncbi:hypothetical protein GOP47_0006163 [Adiantum capillus-veneris]|uniref:Uncharacterized protein n=1 Tax=Adiantum capillus-veneris TaxID=13818 RepID=A0A9D4V3V9_ADICA|nr:hypothetical protein GOP47_0006163 [Adiantum capillus-veneris]